MRRHVFFIIIILVGIVLPNTQAQDNEPIIELSSDYKIPNATVLQSILTSDSESIYLLRKDYSGLGRQLRSVIVESYDRKTLKLNKAILLLSTNKHSMTEICHLCGFYDQSHFISNFKKSYNTTPFKCSKLLSLR